MKGGMQLEQRQFMKLVLTPQMHQALHVLQASVPELGEFLERKASENPFLEIEWKSGGEASYIRASSAGSDSSSGGLEFRASASEGLEDYLLQQLRMSGCPKPMEKVAAFLIGNIDEAGYLRIDTAEAASILNVSEEQVEEAVRLLQTFDPPGIAARNLQECLLLQIRSHDNPAPYAEEIIAMYIEELAAAKTQFIMKSLGIEREDLEEAVQFIQSLNPRPGLEYSQVQESYVIPDAEITVSQERLEIRMLDASLPAVTIHDEYKELFAASGGEIDPALREKWNEALAIVASLEKRKSTLHRLIVTIAEAQSEFFHGGWDRLRALTNKQLAEMLDLHESTVSRAIQNKYVLTRFGVIALKDLLSTPLPTRKGTQVSARAVKSKIAQMISEEDKRAPLSDQKIAELLQADGIMISRRGVTKYRHELKIKSASLRRIKQG
jgi:RNA polymerase sigma-54 factor